MPEYAARSSALSVLDSLKRELGDLDLVPDFAQATNVINGFSDLILEIPGPEAGTPARVAPGVATLPLGLPVSIGAEVEISAWLPGLPTRRTELHG